MISLKSGQTKCIVVLLGYKQGFSTEWHEKKLVVWLKGNIDTLLLSYLVFGGEASWAKNCRQNSWKVKEEAEKA